MWWGRKPKERLGAGGPQLREQILTVGPDSLGLGPSGALANVWAVLMEMGYPKAVASLVAVADGGASLYFSNGGGIIGCGENDDVRPAVFGLLTAAEAHLSLLTPTRDTPLPEIGRVRFYVRTFGGTLAAEASEDEISENRHSLGRLYAAGHRLITAIREASTRPG